MKFRGRGLLGTIERDLLAERPIASLLRQVVLLGGQTGSRELREWAGHELRGYGNGTEVPSYRAVFAPIQMDYMSSWTQVKRQRVGVSELPDFAQEDIDERFELTQGVGELESLLRTRGDDKFVKLSLPAMRELGRVMEHERGGALHIDSIYWSVSTSAIEGVLDSVRTRLAELIAEMRSFTAGSQILPTAEQADAAVQIVISGRNAQVVLNSISSGDGSVIAVNNSSAPPKQETVFWTTSRRVGGVIVGLATVAGVAVAVLQLTK